MRGPSILIENPDLLNVTPEWLQERQGIELVLLDDAFRERVSGTSPQGRARHYTYWSYVEGIRAEELSRAKLGCRKGCAAIRSARCDSAHHVKKHAPRYRHRVEKNPGEPAP